MRTYRASETDSRRTLSDENKMGLILLIVALLSFGAYAMLFFVGFLSDVLG